MVSAFDSGSIGSGNGLEHCVVFLGKTLLITLTVPLSSQACKWVPANLMLGCTVVTA